MQGVGKPPIWQSSAAISCRFPYVSARVDLAFCTARHQLVWRDKFLYFQGCKSFACLINIHGSGYKKAESWVKFIRRSSSQKSQQLPSPANNTRWKLCPSEPDCRDAAEEPLATISQVHGKTLNNWARFTTWENFSKIQYFSKLD